MFQSTRPRGARPAPKHVTLCAGGFQSTRPRGARPVRLRKTAQETTKFQSTRPRGARRIQPPTQGDRRVSIHAPTWGATREKPNSVIILAVSIHAPTWGATCRSQPTHRRSRFQSTRPRGARQRPHTSITINRCFNPRAHVGRDIIYCKGAVNV